VSSANVSTVKRGGAVVISTGVIEYAAGSEVNGEGCGAELCRERGREELERFLPTQMLPAKKNV